MASALATSALQQSPFDISNLHDSSVNGLLTSVGSDKFGNIQEQKCSSEHSGLLPQRDT